MLVLAFDTATPAVTVALHDGGRLLGSVSTVDAMRHGELLVPAIAGVIADAGVSMRDVTDVAVGVGPGPYTGLRVGVVTGRTLAASLGACLHAVCTLDVIAAATSVEGPFAVATDARRKEVYWALYGADRRRVDGPAVVRPAELAAQLARGMPVVGRGAQAYAEVLPTTQGPLDPDAGVLAALVARGEADEVAAEPMYLRRPDATPPGERKQVS